MEIIINIIGWLLIWSATDIGRTKDSKIIFLSKNWWAIFILIVIGVGLQAKYV